MGNNMTAASLLAELKRQGFRLKAEGNDIRIAPAKRLTEALSQDIRQYKSELLALLHAGAPPAAQLPTPKAEQSAPVAAAPTPPKPEMAAPEVPPKPPLCPRCRPDGKPRCNECLLASDPGLELHHGTLFRVRPPPEPVIMGWHRCEVCNVAYHGRLPPYGVSKLCPKCLPDRGSGPIVYSA
jgi:hypothetical protein